MKTALAQAQGRQTQGSGCKVGKSSTAPQFPPSSSLSTPPSFLRTFASPNFLLQWLSTALGSNPTGGICWPHRWSPSWRPCGVPASPASYLLGAWMGVSALPRVPGGPQPPYLFPFRSFGSQPPPGSRMSLQTKVRGCKAAPGFSPGEAGQCPPRGGGAGGLWGCRLWGCPQHQGRRNQSRPPQALLHGRSLPSPTAAHPPGAGGGWDGGTTHGKALLAWISTQALHTLLSLEAKERPVRGPSLEWPGAGATSDPEEPPNPCSSYPCVTVPISDCSSAKLQNDDPGSKDGAGEERGGEWRGGVEPDGGPVLTQRFLASVRRAVSGQKRGD